MKDLFSTQSSDYARFRPTYPPALFEWLAGQAPARETAVDVGTGSGQAAVALAAHFGRVLALDPSAAQLANAT
ncbi:MAG TPA: methyltransferase domain-containing protein, partial [Polyangia bacterium]